MNRVKISVSIDPSLLRVVDEFVRTHDAADRSKVVDEALGLWTAVQQDAAMEAQFAVDEVPTAERDAWRAIRDAAAESRLARR